MRFVVDVSVVAGWALPDEDHPTAALAFAQLAQGGVAAPSLLWFELRNILVMNERRGRISQADTAVFLEGFSRARIEIDARPDEAAVLRLARTHRLTIYDAAYLELAQRNGAALATLDQKLAAAARMESVAVFGEET